MRYLKSFNESSDIIRERLLLVKSMVNWDHINYITDKLSSYEDGGYFLSINIGYPDDGYFESAIVNLYHTKGYTPNGQDLDVNDVYYTIIDKIKSDTVVYELSVMDDDVLLTSDFFDDIRDRLSKKFKHVELGTSDAFICFSWQG